MSKFKLVPTSKGANRGIYFGRIDQYDSATNAWNVVSESKQVLFEWRKVSVTPSATNAAVEATNASIETPSASTPDIISFSADDVETLQLGSMVPFAIFSETGQLLDMPDINIEEKMVSLDLSEVVGDVKLYVAKWETKSVPITSDGQTIRLDGIFRPCGIITDNDTILREWSQVKYSKGRTYITFDTVPEKALMNDNILVYPETLMHVIKNSSTDTSVNLRGEYPVRTLSSEGTVWSDNSLAQEGTTYVEVQRNFSLISLVAADWVYKIEDKAYKTGTDRISSQSPEATGDIKIAWSDIIDNPGSSTTDIDAAVHRILNVLDYEALQAFSEAGGTLTRHGLVIDSHKEVYVTNEGGIEVFYIDVSSADSFFIHPTGEYRVEFTNCPSFIRDISVLVLNGGIDVSTWHASCDFGRQLESNGLNLLSFQSISAPGSPGNEVQIFGENVSYISLDPEEDPGSSNEGGVSALGIHDNTKHSPNYEEEGTADNKMNSHELMYEHANIPTHTEKLKITNLPSDANSVLSNKQDVLVEGAFVNGDKTKLNNIENYATSDMTDAEIKIAYENNADTNAYTDSEKAKVSNVPADTITELSNKQDELAEGPFEDGDKTKLDGISGMTDAEIKTAYENNSNTNAYTDSEESKVSNVPADTITELSNKQDEPSEGPFEDGDKTKLDSIENNATADQTDSEIKIGYENNADTNAYTDSEKAKVSNVPADTNSALYDKQDKLLEGPFEDGDKTKLDGIEGDADKTDADNVNAVESDPVVGSIDGIVMADGAGSISAAIANKDYASADRGVPNGSLHDHHEGDGGTIPHGNLGGIGTDDHHERYADTEAVSAMGTKENSNPLHHDRHTAAQIKTDYESNTDTNAYTDSEKAKVGNVPADTINELSNKQDELAEGPFEDGDKTKLDGIEDGATADQTDSEIKVAYENNTDTNAYTDSEKSKVGTLQGVGSNQGELAEWDTGSGQWIPTGIAPSPNNLIFRGSAGWELLSLPTTGNYALVVEGGVLGWRELGC